MESSYDRDRVVWWLRSPGNNDNKAAVVIGGDGGAGNVNNNNVKNKNGVRPALPCSPKRIESSVRLCAGGKGTRFLFTDISVEKYMLSEWMDADAFIILELLWLVFFTAGIMVLAGKE